MTSLQDLSPGPPPIRPRRVVRADELLQGKVTLEGYPFRYAVLTSAGVGNGLNTMYDVVLSAVEFLETRGWALVAIGAADGIIGVTATMRRF